MIYYNSPRWSGEVLDCSMPMTFDTYNKCSYNCLYCFSYFQKSHTLKLKNYQTKQDLQSVNTERIKEIFLLKRKSQFSDYIEQKKVMQWGGLADQFDEYEKQNGKTLELMRFFKEINYPLCFSTKATWFLKDDRYVDLIKDQKNWNFKFSIITYNNNVAEKIEKGVDSPKERLSAINKINQLNCGGATLRLRPFIFGISDDYIELLLKSIEHGISAVSTEFLCLEGRADQRLKNRYAEISKIIGFDILDFYKKHSFTKNGYMRLNRSIKLPIIIKMKKICDENNIRFYSSDAHVKEFCHNGSCCGLDESWNYSRGQFTEALLIAKKNGKVRFCEIEKDIEHFKKIKWKSADGFNTSTAEKRIKLKNYTMYDFIRSKWNTPNDNNSPYKYFLGKMLPIGVDEDKNIIYKYVSS